MAPQGAAVSPFATLSSYEASYLELALTAALPLATFDENLRRAAQKAGIKHFKASWRLWSPAPRRFAAYFTLKIAPPRVVLRAAANPIQAQSAYESFRS